MWILVEVDKPHDVGKDELQRILILDMTIDVDPLFSDLRVVAEGHAVHPATPSDADECYNIIMNGTPVFGGLTNPPTTLCGKSAAEWRFYMTMKTIKHKTNEHLLGAKIISIDDEFGSVDSIVVATTDERQFVISGEEYAEGDPDLVINEVKHTIKVDRGDIIKRGD